MDCKIDSHYTGGVNCHVYDSLNCKGCCSGGNSSPPRDEHHVHFSQAIDLYDESRNNAAKNHQFPVGICTCCKDSPCQPFPKSCQNFGRPVLVYEIPSPKFEGKTTHQRDFEPKPVPVKELPPWHPILKDRWKSLNVPSLNKSTYQSDFTPCVATQECRKPVYLAPKERKDRCQKLSETFKTWIKTSKGPSKTHEVCDKPLLGKTTLVLKESVPLSDHEFPQDPSYRSSNEHKHLHGPECEKHCYSTPLMCHVSSPRSHGERYHAFESHGDETICNKHGKNTVQSAIPDCGLTDMDGHQHHMGLLDSKAVGTFQIQKEGNSSEELDYKDGHLIADDENKRLRKHMMLHPNAIRHSCHNSARDPANFSGDICATMKHPGGDGYGSYSQREQQHLITESKAENKHKSGLKHVHFADTPEVCCDRSSPRNQNSFTLCEDSTYTQPKYWWKKMSCEPQRNGVDVVGVPHDVTKPACPSYLTIHKRDFTEPCPEYYRRSSSDDKNLPAECACTGDNTENILMPQFERGGLI